MDKKIEFIKKSEKKQRTRRLLDEIGVLEDKGGDSRRNEKCCFTNRKSLLTSERTFSVV